MNLTKHFFPSLLAAVLLFGCSTSVQASEMEFITAETYTQTVSLPDNSLLYDGYLNHLFYPDSAVSFLGEAARNQLTPLGRKLYDFLKANLQSVASGDNSSTVFTLSSARIAEWGATTSFMMTSGQSAQDAANAALVSLKNEMGVDAVISALLHDCPYELYWYDKVTGVTETATFSLTSSQISVTSFVFRFSVVKDLQAEGYSEEDPKFDTTQIVSAAAAAENARSIVSKYERQTDYNKLLGYKNEICSLVSYNRTAASWGNFSEDADPWQLIYVFDGNTSTNVVCEGYSKAFQYLYDLSNFNGSVDCITVTGDTSGEGHMWNIVSINGNHYLADITNSDAYATGADGGLFLAGASGSILDGYTARGLLYTYHSNTLTLWGTDSDSKLNISPTAFSPCAAEHTEETIPAKPATCDATGLTEGKYCRICGEVTVKQEIVPVLGHDMSQWQVTKPATCAKEGQQEKVCQRSGCNYTETQTLPLTSHEYTATVTDPTCTEKGYTSHTCACGDSYTDSTVDELGHNMGNWQTAKEATCAEDGSQVRDCQRSNCDHSETQIIPATEEHTYDNRYDATCNACGFRRTVEPETVSVYRLYNPYTQEHLLTSTVGEKDLLLSIGWTLDGVAWEAPVEGIPVYRLYNPYDDWHTYTTSVSERDTMAAAGWQLDGVVSRGETGEDPRPIYRLFNPYIQTNYHLFTAGTEERDLLVNAGWILEGIAWNAAK